MREPDLQALPAGFNPKLEDVIRRCLAKDSRQRWHSIADVRLQLDAVIAEPRASSAASSTRPLWRRAFPIAAAALITFIITAVFFYNLRPSQPLNVVRFPFVLAEGQGFRFANRHMLAISPDGTNLVFAADRQLYLRKMNDPDARPVQGTADQRPTTPVFSPDGHWVAFYSFSDQRIKKIAVTGGPAVTICEADNPLGAVWATNDQLFIGQGKNILRVSGKGGKPETVVALKPNEIAQSPQLLPGDDALLFTLAQTGDGIDRWDKAQMVVQSLRTGERKVVLEGGSDARYVPTGHLIYAVGTTLLAVPFDSKTDRVTGAPAPVPVVEKVMRTLNRGTGAAQFSVSNNGTLAFVPGDAAVASGVLALVDRAGARKTIDVPPDGYVHLRISPNGKQLVMSADNSGGERIVYVYDLNNNAPRRRLTFEGHNTTAIWRDSQRVVFRSDRQTGIGLYQQTADGVRPAELLLKFNPGDSPSPEFFSLDGKTLVFSNAPAGPNTARSLYSLQLDKSEEPKLLVEHASNASLSPDGKWFAYSSTGGRSEVYVQAFPPTSAKYLVSTDGGDNPVWSPDGSELFYLSIASREIRSVQVQTQPTFLPRQTSRLPISLILISGPRAYDVTPDGKYFVATFPRSSGNGTDKAPLEQINITLNWFEELKQLVPVK